MANLALSCGDQIEDSNMIDAAMKMDRKMNPNGSYFAWQQLKQFCRMPLRRSTIGPVAYSLAFLLTSRAWAPLFSETMFGELLIRVHSPRCRRVFGRYLSPSHFSLAENTLCCESANRTDECIVNPPQSLSL